MNSLKRKIEAVLFAGSRRMELGEIKGYLEEDDDKILAALEDLKDEYDKNDTALRIIHENESWKFSLKTEYLATAEKLMPSTELPKQIVETLAIIAWKNPILQSDLVKMRSAAVYEHIAELEKLHLIIRSKKGRSYIVKVTDKFYDYFDIPRDSATEMFDQYEEIAEEKAKEESEFNKGDSFEMTEEEKEKQLLQEIKENKINPEDIIKKDKEFLDDFDSKLKEIESQSSAADRTLKELERIETDETESEESDSEEVGDVKIKVMNEIEENIEEDIKKKSEEEE